jgi:hypothetical protein
VAAAAAALLLLLRALLAEAVVHAALLRVGEDLVRGGDLLESVRRVGLVGVAVGVEAAARAV